MTQAEIQEADYLGAHALLTDLFQVAVEAAQPRNCLAPHLPAMPENGNLIVVGAGKASAAMAAAVEEHYQRPLTGLVITRYGYSVPTRHIEIVEAAHPVPDQAGVEASQRLLKLVSNRSADDLVLVLISGGGSALLTAPVEPLTLGDKQAINAALLKSGAPISEMNIVRKQFSNVKGGRLAAAIAPARLCCLMISDVPGDDPAIIASGPTVPAPNDRERARQIVQRYDMDLPLAAQTRLDSPPNASADQAASNTEVTNIIAARPGASLEAAADHARAQGFECRILGDDLEGEAHELAIQHARLSMRFLAQNKRVILLSGGETTVTHDGSGKGGPNGEYTLALLEALKGQKGICAIGCDTDGIDGTEDNAGAWFSPATYQRGKNLGLSVENALKSHNSYDYFASLGNLVISGPTLTNVNDFRAILIAPEEAP